MICKKARADYVRGAMKEMGQESSLSDDELCRIHHRVTRNPNPGKQKTLSEIVAKAQYRSRSRRSR